MNGYLGIFLSHRYLVGKPLLSGAMQRNETSEEWFIAKSKSISIMALQMDGKCFHNEAKRWDPKTRNFVVVAREFF